MQNSTSRNECWLRTGLLLQNSAIVGNIRYELAIFSSNNTVRIFSAKVDQYCTILCNIGLSVGNI